MMLHHVDGQHKYKNAITVDKILAEIILCKDGNKELEELVQIASIKTKNFYSKNSQI